MIVPGLQFQKSSDTFGQWVDSSSQLYGLNFLSAPEAEQVRRRRRSAARAGRTVPLIRAYHDCGGSLLLVHAQFASYFKTAVEGKRPGAPAAAPAPAAAAPQPAAAKPAAAASPAAAAATTTTAAHAATPSASSGADAAEVEVRMIITQLFIPAMAH